MTTIEGGIMNYSCFESASGKFVITGPGIYPGELVRTNSQDEAISMCRILNEVYKAGRRNKAAEIKKALND